VHYLKRLQIGETVRDLGLQGQKQKEGTPTMGGIIIIMAILIPCLLMADLSNVYIILMLLATTLMGVIGFLDDYIKVFRKNKEGLSGVFKIIGQVAFGLIVALTMLFSQDIVVRMDQAEAEAGGYRIVKVVNLENGEGVAQDFAYVQTTLTNVPFFKGNNFDYRSLVSFLGDNADVFLYIVFVLIVIFIVTAVSNAANLTDGLDGLATGVSAIIGVTLAIFAYVSGNSIAADYLNILFLPGSSELVIFSACFLGACVGFLWYNSYPAQIFMGDTGSLTLGGIIAAMAILLRKELLIPLLCGIFLMENLSVVMQVAYFKFTKRRSGQGKRIFLMSPLHHHYKKKGMPESKIVTRFWIVGIMLAVVTILTLKIR
jgi:phospho-N-acetylmuramoyl-pentapeptide-transferase